MAERPSLSSWVQIFTNLIVIAGVLLVAYEIRQNKEMVGVQLAQGAWAMYHSEFIAMMGEDPAISLEKMVRGDQLEDVDRIVIDSFLTALSTRWRQNLALEARGSFGRNPVPITALDAVWYLNTPYGREWWSETRKTMPESLRLAVDEMLSNADPEENFISYYRRMRNWAE